MKNTPTEFTCNAAINFEADMYIDDSDTTQLWTTFHLCGSPPKHRCPWCCQNVGGMTQEKENIQEEILGTNTSHLISRGRLVYILWTFTHIHIIKIINYANDCKMCVIFCLVKHLGLRNELRITLVNYLVSKNI